MERQRRWGNAVVIRRRSARFRSRVVGSCRFFKISGKTSGFYSRNSHDQICRHSRSARTQSTYHRVILQASQGQITKHVHLDLWLLATI
uniref:uncharacterized protein LOC101302505 isoform X4 n=1 Tax=Fragaria vesca subsp. vesca TaxID=101020 RepID=UPI0005C9915A|nr:PREDICTED: uncharacterized protein LOC101302505 isoform X4 [Fragaria vesca subsp. vesca]